MKARPRLRYLIRAAAVVLAVYLLFLGVLFYFMSQPPERFGGFMSHLPMPFFLVIPFEPLWNVARGGTLQVGDMAPDFHLRTADRSASPEKVQLSASRGKQPVVLVFGSYT